MAYVPNLTPLRGIGALMIVVLHFSGPGFLQSLAWNETIPFVGKSYLAVDFFFLLSGYVIAHVHAREFLGTVHWRTVADFLWARFARIYPVYLFVLLYFVAGWHRVDVDLLYSLLLIQSPWTDHVLWNFPTWAISAEWHAYLAFPFIAAVLYRQRASVAVVLILACAIVLSCVNLRFGFLRMTNGAEVLLRVIPEFIIGVMIQRLQASGLRLSFGRHAFPVALIAVAMAMSLSFPDVVIVLLEAVLLCSAIEESDSLAVRWFNARPMVFLGDISYSVYVNHIFIFSLINALPREVLPPYGIKELDRVHALLVLICLVTLVIAWSAVTYHYVELPAKHWLRSRRWYGVGDAKPGPATTQAR